MRSVRLHAIVAATALATLLASSPSSASPSGTPGVVVWSGSVSANGAAVTVPLGVGVYNVSVTGTVSWWGARLYYSDAAYEWWPDGRACGLGSHELLVNGLSPWHRTEVPSVPAPGALPLVQRYGTSTAGVTIDAACRPVSHAYTTELICATPCTLSLAFHDDYYGDNSGAFAVTIGLLGTP
ncbi:MAG: hypothetical protein ACYDCK_04595 [Thermoplasmatota archaeon]